MASYQCMVLGILLLFVTVCTANQKTDALRRVAPLAGGVSKAILTNNIMDYLVKLEVYRPNDNEKDGYILIKKGTQNINYCIKDKHFVDAKNIGETGCNFGGSNGQTNLLTGSIPAFYMMNLTQLKQWNMGYSQLVGSLAGEFSGPDNFKNLEQWVLNYNFLEGPLPHNVFLNKAKLITCSLAGNLLNGKLLGENGLDDKGLSGLTSIRKLYLGENDFTGELPSALFQPSLYLLQLESNNFHGQIPSDIGKLVQVTQLYIQNNKLSGTIPSQLGLCINLKKLQMQENFLQGMLPDLSKLEFLSEFYVYTNKLSGAIPDSLGLMPGLTNLRLYHKYDNDFVSTANVWKKCYGFDTISIPNKCDDTSDMDTDLYMCSECKKRSDEKISITTCAAQTSAAVHDKTIFISIFFSIVILIIVVLFCYQYRKATKSVRVNNIIRNETHRGTTLIGAGGGFFNL